MTLAIADPCSMKTASLPNCGSARLSAEGISTSPSTCRGDSPSAFAASSSPMGVVSTAPRTISVIYAPEFSENAITAHHHGSRRNVQAQLSRIHSNCDSP